MAGPSNEGDEAGEHREVLGGAEREPVIAGLVYLLLVIGGIAAVVFWIVLRSPS